MNKYGLCFQEDNFCVDYRESNTRWVVTLNNGEVVYCDKGRTKDDPPWERLGYYCKENDLHIVKMYIQFRSNSKSIPENKDGYFFSRVVRGSFGNEKSKHFFLVGYEEKGIVYIEKYAVPELLKQESFQRSPDNLGICLISKNDYDKEKKSSRQEGS